MNCRLASIFSSSLLCVSLAAVAACAGKSETSGHGADSSTARLGTGSEPTPEYAASRPAADAAGEAAEAEAVYEERWDDDGARDRVAKEKHRPGLGTEFGETRRSHASSTRFERAHPRRPEALFTLGYDDSHGIDAMSRRGFAVDDWGWAREEDHARGVSVSVLDAGGHPLRGTTVEGRRYAIGEAGQRYKLGIENDSEWRYEVVASVDGLDVIDGDEAALSKRGYVIAPYSSVVIEGWRTSTATVAAFRFSNIEESYAERKGKGRNIGVIGAAFFVEDHEESEWEHRRRREADPFPGR